MSAVLLDASAVLAVLLDEPGADRVREALADGAISAVNAAEVVGSLADLGLPGEAAEAVFQGLMIESRDFSAAAGRDAGRIRAQMRARGLSLGDRACLAEARQSRLPVLTADRAWEGLGLGVDVEVIR